MKETTYGYARVSGRDQNEQRQILALSAFGIKKKTFFVINSPARTLTGRDI